MAKLDKKRRMVVEEVKKFEKTAHEIHEMANELHKKMEQLHREAIATRERVRTTGTVGENNTKHSTVEQDHNFELRNAHFSPDSSNDGKAPARKAPLKRDSQFRKAS